MLEIYLIFFVVSLFWLNMIEKCFVLVNVLGGAQQVILFEKNVPDCGAMIQMATPWCSE